MTDFDVLDQKALASARRYMDAVAWPTVVLGLVVGVSYLANIAMALTGLLTLWIAMAIYGRGYLRTFAIGALCSGGVIALFWAVVLLYVAVDIASSFIYDSSGPEFGEYYEGSK